MRSLPEFPDMDDGWNEPIDETASDIRSVLEWCPVEIKSRQLEQSTPRNNFDAGTHLFVGVHSGRKRD